MDVFVTGGTGVLGRPVVRLLVEQGHRVRGLARSDTAAEILRNLGAVPVTGDLFDPSSVRQAVGAAEAVLHLATSIPATNRVRHPSAWVQNDRIRREGTRNLVDAALAGAASTLVYPSVVFVYPDRGSEWIDATTTDPAPLGALHSTLDAEADVTRVADAGRRGISLRMGAFYGPDSPHSRQAIGLARWGLAMVLGRDDAYQSSIWVDDAAHAVLAALVSAPSGIYDVVDDDPLRRDDLAAAIGRAVGRRRLLRPPAAVARLATGAELSEVFSRSQRASNARFKRATGWVPRVPDARAGWQLMAIHAGSGSHRDGWR